MKKVILEDNTTINLDKIPEDTPIFARMHGCVAGMILQNAGTDRWALHTGGKNKSNGFHDTRKKCIETNYQFGYEFYVE